MKATRPLQLIPSDLWFAIRRLSGAPGFLMFAAMSLALGIGVPTAVYSVVRAMVWAPFGVRDADTLAVLETADAANATMTWTGAFSVAEFDALRARSHALDGAAATERTALPIEIAAQRQVVPCEAVTDDYFSTLREIPRAGQLIHKGTGAAAAVISNRLWASVFDSSPDALGRQISVDGEAFEIVGVARPAFDGVHRRGAPATAVWIPLSTATVDRSNAPIARHLTVVGRVQRGAMNLARTEVEQLSRQIDLTIPAGGRTGTPVARRWTLQAYDQGNAPPDRVTRSAFIAVGLVGMLIVVACTNLGNLVLARGIERMQELATRSALGASRQRLVVMLLAEQVVIAVVGLVGAAFVYRVVAAMFTADLPMQGHIVRIIPQFDWTAILFALGATVTSLVICGLGPALRLTQTELRTNLSGDSGRVDARSWKSQQQFLRWQVAISTTFLLVATMCGRLEVNRAQHDSGVDLNDLVVARVSAPQVDKDAADDDLVDAVLERAAKDPAIRSVAASDSLPFGQPAPLAELSTIDKPLVPAQRYPSAIAITATPGVFDTLGVPILHGRPFGPADLADTLPVAVISQTAARQIFGTEDVIGTELRLRIVTANRANDSGEVRTIVGIARDTDVVHLFSRSVGSVYLPFAQHPVSLRTVVAKASGPTPPSVDALRAAIARTDGIKGIEVVGTGFMLLGGVYVLVRAVTGIALALGIVTLVLSMVGLYGVLSQVVSGRTREVGLRLALGATPGNVRLLIVAQGLRPVAEGIALGLTFAVVVRSLVRALVVGALPVADPITFTAAALPLFLAALLACYLPSRRATRLDPSAALRAT